MPEFSTIVLRSTVLEVRPGYGRNVLEKEALPIYLPKRRWFASKTDTLLGVHIAYFVQINPAPEAIFITEVEVTLKRPDGGNRTERYTLPIGIVWEDAAVGNLPGQLAMARVRLGARVGFLTDAFAIDGFTRAVLRGLRERSTITFDGGTLEFRPTSLMDRLELSEDAEIRRLSAEQSNSSLIVGDKLVMKVVRRVAPGVHPEGEITRYLTECGFGNTAPLYGEIVRVDPDGTPNTIGIVQGFVRNQGDGWGWTLEYLERTVAELSTTDSENSETAFIAYNVFAAAIGQRLAQLHQVFATPTTDPAFNPEPATDDVLEEWASGAVEQIDIALNMLERLTEWPNPQVESIARTLLSHADGIRM